MEMLHTSELDMAASVDTSDTFLTNVAWAIHSTYHTVLKASPGAAIFGQGMLFDIPFLADWNKIEDYSNARQISRLSLRADHAKHWIIKSAIQCCYGKMVSQKAIMNVILVLSHLFIQMA